MLTAEQIKTVSENALREEALWMRSEVERLRDDARKQVSWERERIMREAAQRQSRPQRAAVVEWVSPTNRIVCAGEEEAPVWVLHVRDPAVPPRLERPTTRRGRYAVTGDIREAGPGSFIGVALCGLPLMAGEVWCSAAGSLRHAVAHGSACECVELCGLCSYLSCCPTVETALEAASRRETGRREH